MGNRNTTTGHLTSEHTARVVGYEEFQKALQSRNEFFTRLGQSATVEDVQKSPVSVVVAKNFRLVRPISHGCNGIVYEVKCIGEGHPKLFMDQSYVLKAPFNISFTTTSVQTAFENEYLVSSTLEPHPNINRYFCHFTDRIPQEYYNHLPPVAKELAFDKVQKRMHACMWVVFEHHSETLEKFLSSINTPITPWPIVHKYSRDICAALVHLFLNHTIHFDLKLDNIVISSNKEQAILIDLGCAKKFSRTRKAFEIDTVSLISITGNTSHRAPEILNGTARYRQDPDAIPTWCCDKQASFELGCILFELSMCGKHPLPGYPGGYGPGGKVTFSFEREELFPMKPTDFPKEFCNVVRSLLQCDPEKRMPLLEASEVLSNLESPCPSDLLSFYTGFVPLSNDAVMLTTKATCQILCGATEDSLDTLHKALEIEPLFSPALLLLHYLHSYQQKLDHSYEQAILTALTGRMASFTTTDVEFTRAIISRRHSATLPELVLAALWTKHISHKVDEYRTLAKLLLKKIPESEGQSQQQSMELNYVFLKKVIATRNETMLGALLQLEVGNIDFALALVASASLQFQCEMMNCPSGVAQHCEYLPALLFLYCLRCVINDHLSLQQHIPTSLSEAFSQAVSSTLESMRALCRRVLNDTTNVGGAEFSDLATTVALRANVDNQTSAMMSSEQSWSCMYFVALWRTFCSSHIQCKGAAHIWEELSSMTPASSQPHNMMTGSVGASSLTRLGLCYELGVGGVHKDFNKAVELYRRAADSGDATALCVLVGVCHHWNDEFGLYVRAAGGIYTQAACHCHGTPQAVTLLQQASDAGIAQAMNNLAACYERGLGVGRDIPKAVTLYQGAASAGHAVAMYNLGAFYFYGTGVVKDMDKAVSLWRRAAQLGNEEAIAKLRDNGKTESE